MFAGFFESLLLFFPELLLLFEGLSHQLAFFPFKHAVCALLVLFIESRLFHNHLFEEVFLGFKDKDLPQALLMLLDAQPVVVRHLNFGQVLLVFPVQIKHRVVNRTQI